MVKVERTPRAGTSRCPSRLRSTTYPVDVQLMVVVTTAGSGPEPGTPVHVEVRDTSVADAPATVVAATTEPVGGAVSETGAGLAEVVLDLPDEGAPQDWTVWAHVQRTGATGVGAGDWITVQSYPVSSATERASRAGGSLPCVEVEVVQI